MVSKAVQNLCREWTDTDDKGTDEMTREQFQKHYYKAHSYATEKVGVDSRTWGDLLADKFCELLAKDAPRPEENGTACSAHREYNPNCQLCRVTLKHLPLERVPGAPGMKCPHQWVGGGNPPETCALCGKRRPQEHVPARSVWIKESELAKLFGDSCWADITAWREKREGDSPFIEFAEVKKSPVKTVSGVKK